MAGLVPGVERLPQRRQNWDLADLDDDEYAAIRRNSQIPVGIEDIKLAEIPTHCGNPGLFMAKLRQRCRPNPESRAIRPRNKTPDVRPIDTFQSPEHSFTYRVEVEDSLEGRRFIFHKNTDAEIQRLLSMFQPNLPILQTTQNNQNMVNASQPSTSGTSSNN